MDFLKALGQLFLLGFHGEDISSRHPIVADIRQRNLGGVILFERLLAKNLTSNNIISATQVKNLTTKLQKAAEGRLLIGADQEGGRVSRFADDRGFPLSVKAADLGNRDETVLTEIHSLATADMLKCLGININLAPVVDLNIVADNPIIGALGRSFSSEAAKVVRHAAVWIKAHRSRHILSCLKHFPGHGSSRNDSHLGFVDISETWSREELYPFDELNRRGLADVIMTGHLFNRSLDIDAPATLSHNTITGLLRRELQFDGVVMTDDLQMKAITDHYGLEETVCKAFSAGVDMIVIGNNLEYDPEVLDKALRAVSHCVQTGTLKEEMLTKSIERVKKLKDRHFSSAVSGAGIGGALC